MTKVIRIKNLLVEIGEEGIFFKLKKPEGKNDISENALEYLKDHIADCLKDGTPITEFEINNTLVTYKIKRK